MRLNSVKNTLYIQGMTESELHALMTSAFASISGAGLAVYVSVGASATHLISASLISAPAGANLFSADLSCLFVLFFFPSYETQRLFVSLR